MNNSLILNYIDRNINRLQALDYVLLGIAALAVLFVLFLAARGLYRLLQSKKRSMQGVLPSASLASQYRDLVRQASAERSLLERQASGGGESFALLKTLYREKKDAGAKPEDLSERMLNYTLSMRPLCCR